MKQYIARVDGEPGASGFALPDLPECAAMGAATGKTIANARLARRGWIEATRPSDSLAPDARPPEALKEKLEARRSISAGARLAAVS